MDHRVLVSADVIFARRKGNATRRRKRFIDRKMRVKKGQSEKATSEERKDKKAEDVHVKSDYSVDTHVKCDEYSVDTLYLSDSNKGI